MKPKRTIKYYVKQGLINRYDFDKVIIKNGIVYGKYNKFSHVEVACGELETYTVAYKVTKTGLMLMRNNILIYTFAPDA